MCMSYLYSKLPETGVSPHIGTGGTEAAFTTYSSVDPLTSRHPLLAARIILSIGLSRL